MASSKSTNLFSQAKLDRLKRSYTNEELTSRRAFNLLMGAIVAYGLGMNILFCKLFPNVLANISPIVYIIGYFVCVFAGVAIAHKSDNPFISFLGYNLIVLPIGVMLTGVIKSYGGLDSEIVVQAFAYTFAITVIMTAAGACFPDFFAKIGRTLFVCLLGLLICTLISLFFRHRPVMFDLFGAGLFSLYIGYDFHRSQQYAPTYDNAVDCALDIYMDIINLFLRILRILAESKKN